MEIFSSKPTILILLLLLLLTTVTTADLTSKELDAALLALQSRGYTLFPNAITTSDLHVRLLSSQNSSFFTLFAPPDSLLFSLDLLSSARLYTFSLFLHVSPLFLSTSDLLALPRPAYIETLLPKRQLFVEHTLAPRNGTVLLSVTVDGVGVSVPDLFLGSNIAVHGLDGILVTRYESWVSDGGSTGFAEAPKCWCKTYISPANPPESLPPMGEWGAGDGDCRHRNQEKWGADHDDDRGTTTRARHDDQLQNPNVSPHPKYELSQSTN